MLKDFFKNIRIFMYKRQSIDVSIVIQSSFFDDIKVSFMKMLKMRGPKMDPCGTPFKKCFPVTGCRPKLHSLSVFLR